MRFPRFIGAILLLVGVAAVGIMQDPLWLSFILLASFSLYALSGKNLLRSLAATLPVAVFALILILMQWISGMPITLLGFKAVAVFWLMSTICRIIPWSHFTRLIDRKSYFSSLILFVLFTSHFLRILGAESLRLLRARQLCVPAPYGKWAFRSLGAALVSLFSRALIRAERFYVAQLLKGLAG